MGMGSDTVTASLGTRTWIRPRGWRIRRNDNAEPKPSPLPGACRRSCRGSRASSRRLCAKSAGHAEDAPLSSGDLERACQIPGALGAKGGAGIERTYQDRYFPVHAARRHSAPALRSGARRRRRSRLDAARQHAGPLPDQRDLRAALYRPPQGSGELQGSAGLRRTAAQGRVQGGASDLFLGARSRTHSREQAGEDAGGPERAEAPLPDPPRGRGAAGSRSDRDRDADPAGA